VVELAIDPQQLALGTFCFRFAQKLTLSYQQIRSFLEHFEFYQRIR